ncbi:hypothetical protein MOQ_004672 [Trypanosoma cruzi marinkellei]|uniref:PIH1 N-terminal domain-containing protein n=1 Tax=Trypanosoma cruzi marinkellei TaxID=85056 RepID=K2N0F9_TRYCR|nr:hypothetical protein MOQ_004672 [Trypanosoma cruzi marinkellei]
MEAGFCFEALVADNATSVVVNVCGHPSVGMALAKNMEVVPEGYLDKYGVDNLIIPISVGPAEKYDGEKYSFTIDVVVHPTLIVRCVRSHPLFDHYVLRLTNLAIEWILQECGMRINPRSCRLLPDKKYFSSGKDNFYQTLSRIVKAVEKGTTTCPVDGSKDEEISLPSELFLNASHMQDEIKSSPLIKEMPVGTGIRKGFLNGVRLYGAGGSGECDRPTADPLLHLPENLRNRCQVIDTRQVVKGATQVPAATETVHIKEKPKPTNSNITKKKTFQWEVQSVDCNEREIVVRLHPPPNVMSMKDVELTASLDVIEVDEAVIRLPKAIKVDDVSAKFFKSSRTMVLRCPLA